MSRRLRYRFRHRSPTPRPHCRRLVYGNEAKIHVRFVRPERLLLHYYLFSADGCVYRHYYELPVPNGNIALFDFDLAARTDPENSGSYTVDGGRLIIQMGGANPETIMTAIPQQESVNISNVVYKKQ